MSNINRVLSQWPYGLVATSHWLERHGVRAEQAHKWAKSGWLVRIGYGAYARAGDNPGWEGGVAGLQHGSSNRGPAIWPAARTALELALGSHFLTPGKSRLDLWGQAGKVLPRWFAQYDWQVYLCYRNYELFAAPRTEHRFVDYRPGGGGFNLQVSAPEWAVLEWLYGLAREQLFSEQVMRTFEGLTSLRPKMLQAALESCRSVQVKRLFLYLGREFGHAWYPRLDLARVDLGRGKRQLYPAGRLDREFQITVPEEHPGRVI